jgi:hypothetical protein
MAMAINHWATFQSLPVMCVANDNFIDPEDAEAGDEPERRFDNLMTTQSARQTIKLHAKGEPWCPADERFDTPRRNDRTKAPPPDGSHRYNGLDLPTLPDAEGEANRRIDAGRARLRLGHVCSRVLDLASGNSTRQEIAAAFKQPDSDAIDLYVDHAIINWMRDPAYYEYAA